MSELDEVLAHYGVPGMHWGRRKAEEISTSRKQIQYVQYKADPGRPIQTKGGKNYPASEDAIKTAIYKQRAKSSGTQVLSNKELQDLVSRMNLEQQYKKLNPAPMSRGQVFAKIALGLLNSPVADIALNIAKAKAADDPRLQNGVNFAEMWLNFAKGQSKNGKKKK